MSNKRKTIFIITFILGLLIITGFLFFFNKSKNKNTSGKNGSQKFNPIGTTNTNPSTNNTTTPTNTGTEINWVNGKEQNISRFHQLTTKAIAGAAIFENNNSSLLEYVDRATGHIFQMDLNNNKKVTQISNGTILGVHRVLFDSSGNNFIYRYFSKDNNSIASFVSSIGKNNGSFLPFNITNMSLSPDKNSFFYLIKNKSGIIGYTKTLTTSKTQKVFSSPYAEWLSQWVVGGNVLLNTKPSYFANGYLFRLNLANQNMTEILGGVKGLTTLANSDGTYILYGESTNIGPKLYLLNTQTHKTKNLNSYGFPEKCVWGHKNIYIYCAIPNTIVGIDYPDKWYQGLVSFDDYFVKINTQTGNYSTLANSKNETSVDATHLFLDKGENTLFFTNKKDSTLWSFNL